MKILVVEDEKALNEAICTHMNSENHVSVGVLNHFDAEGALVEESFDLVVLDVNLPDGSGMDLLRWMKKENYNTGVLIVSARDSLDDKLEGLDIGADDYLTKPFHMAELNARVKAILRRRKFDGNNTIQFNELILDPLAKTLMVHDVSVPLTAKQFDILSFFVANKHRLITKGSMADHLWEGGAVDRSNLEFIYNHVMKIRNLIKKAGGTDYIQTVYGVGYKFTDR